MAPNAALPFPVALFQKGYGDLISVTPPNATLSPGSKLTPSQLGKVPGVRNPNGTWRGYNWREHVATLPDLMTWTSAGANIGLRAGRFPGIDIDTMDEQMAVEIEAIAHRVLGPAPVRVGRPPKRLLMYQAAAPFGRLRLHITDPGNTTHLVEVLGEGQQYLVYGTHPVTKKPYTWDRDLPAAKELTGVSLRAVEAFLTAVKDTYAARGFVVTKEGDGERRDREVAGDQAGLLAPNDEELLRAVRLIPNTDALFPTRESYIQMGYAIRASARDVEKGYEAFSDWAMRWDNKKGNDPETVRSDWRRMRPPYSIGWDWLAGVARNHGYNDAVNVFDAEGLPPGITLDHDGTKATTPDDIAYTERWLADEVVRRIGDRIRYAAEMGKWLVWDGHRWQLDNVALVLHEITSALHAIGQKMFAEHQGQETEHAAAREVRRIETTRMRNDVAALVRADPRIAVGLASLDANPWVINTPAGVVDLHTGNISQATPDMLITKMTAVGPDTTKEAPLWKKHLREVTQGDQELEDYLQRFAGYALTGSVREQAVLFLWGSGTNGKSVYVNALKEAMGDDYVATAAMDLFTASNFERHSTDIAGLRGKRLVTASETQEGRRWDEQRLKQMTGGEAITARFMRQDNMTFVPQFKLLFLGNHQPKLRDVGPAIQRRLHMAGFTYQVPPEKIDLDLGEKLKTELPQILSWMIEGALRWQTLGKLNPPQAVRAETEEYFEAQDAVGDWIADALERDADAETEPAHLFESWREWAGRNGEKSPATPQALSATLKSRGFKRGRRADSGRRAIFHGLRIKPLSQNSSLL